MKKKILVSGAGGFIGGHLVSKLMKDGFNIVCADIKPFNKWFQIFEENLNHSIDLKDYEACLRVTKNVDYVFNLSCNMGGMGFIENNKAECMLSVLINTNLLRASHINQVKKFLFSSSACVYNIDKQKNTNTQKRTTVKTTKPQNFKTRFFCLFCYHGFSQILPLTGGLRDLWAAL